MRILRILNSRRLGAIGFAFGAISLFERTGALSVRSILQFIVDTYSIFWQKVFEHLNAIVSLSGFSISTTESDLLAVFYLLTLPAAGTTWTTVKQIVGRDGYLAESGSITILLSMIYMLFLTMLFGLNTDIAPTHGHFLAMNVFFEKLATLAFLQASILISWTIFAAMSVKRYILPEIPDSEIVNHIINEHPASYSESARQFWRDTITINRQGVGRYTIVKLNKIKVIKKWTIEYSFQFIEALVIIFMLVTFDFVKWI